MSAHIVIDETATGWTVNASGAKVVWVETDGPEITVTATPDGEQPLAVTLEAPSA